MTITRRSVNDNDYTREARYSDCERYRYSLEMVWDGDLEVLTFIMLNPSTATEEKNDPTVEGCERRARKWGYGGCCILNLFAYRATDPQDMKQQDDPVGEDNDRFLMLAGNHGHNIICAWGNHGSYLDRSSIVLGNLRKQRKRLFYLELNKSGEPKHPLYVSRSVKPTLWLP